MLRTRTRSHHKDQTMSQIFNPQSDSLGPNLPKVISNHLGLLIGLSNKGLSDCDSVRSPTSPLEFRVCSNMTEPLIRSPRSSSHNGHHLNCWGPAKVGLSIVYSLDNDQCFSRDVIFGAAMRIKAPTDQDKSHEVHQEPTSLPEGFSVFPTNQKIKNATSGVIFEIGGDPFEPEPRGFKDRSFSLSSCRFMSTGSGLELHETKSSKSDCQRKTRVLQSRSKLGGECNNSGNSLDMKLISSCGSIGPDNGLLDSPSASDIELSEDYTCIISHGPNPKTIHIYGDQVVEGHSNGYKGLCDRKEKHIPIGSDPPMLPLGDFLSFCYFCNKKLEGGKDIYIYRCGCLFPHYREKAFCSWECRSEEMLMEEDLDENLTTTESQI